MNGDENFLAQDVSPEQKLSGGNKMRKFIWILAFVAATTLVAVAFTQAPATQKPGEPEPEALRVGDVSNVVLFGMPVRYEILEKVYFRDTKTELGSWGEWNGEACLIRMTPDFATNHVEAHLTAVTVASCANSGLLGLKYKDHDKIREFANSWADLYQSTCGDYLGPLGWFPRIQSEKTECTLPAFEEAFLD